ncbi:MAG: YitT family protein [Roseburia sp.]|nr:YitT family protein [Roseburia sp.]
MYKVSKREIINEIGILTIAVAIIAAAVFFFLVPSHAAVSSISGLAIVLSNFVTFTVSEITFILNIGLLLVGFILCGKEFGVKTVYTSIMLPAFMKLFEIIWPNNQSMTGDATLDVVAYVFVVSVGLSILFNRNASSGGLDIVAKIMNKFFHIEIGKAMSLAGMCVALSSAFVYDKKTVVLSVLGTYINGLILDYFIFGQIEKKRVCILTKRTEEVRQFILYELHSGATIYNAYGAYNMEQRTELIVIVDKNEYQRLMKYMAEIDPDAFMTVYTVKEIQYKPKR